MTINLHPTEKQLILYTKGHFKEIDYSRDLKYFAAEMYDLDPERVEQYSINHIVTNLYQKLVDAGFIEFSLKDFLQDTFKRSWLYYNSRSIDYRVVLEQMLAEIQKIRTHGLDLGEVDHSILTDLILMEKTR
jgi:hypothetical protein